MADKSDYLANKFLDHLLGGGDYARPATLYFGLFTTLPGAGGAGGVEVVGGSYARIGVTNNATNFPAATGGSKANATPITFALASGAWGNVVGFGAWDHATAGNLLKFAPLLVGGVPGSRTIGSGDQPSFAAGDLVFTEE